MMRIYRGVFLALAIAAPIDAAGFTPHSGDVDRDGRMTTRDAARVMESLGWPERNRLYGFMSACDVNQDNQCDIADAHAILQVAMVSPGDMDGDGVANAADCSPYDDRLATEHTYYWDKDRDQYGDSSATINVCSVVPEPPLAAWGGDPNDSTPYGMVLPVPKGARVLGLDFAEHGADGYWRPDLAREVGATAATLRLAWADLESAPGVSAPAGRLLPAARAYTEAGFALSLTVSPMSGPFLAAPADLRDAIERGERRLSDPAVIARFKQALTYVHAELGQVPLVSLQIGHDIDEFLIRAPGYFWADFGTLLFEATVHAKSLWGPGVKIGTTATFDGLLSPATREQLQAINQITDVVSFTYLRRPGSAGAIDPGQVRGDFERLLAAYAPRPLHAQAVGYPTAPATGASETKQSQFIRAVFETWDAWPERLPFVSFYRLNDVARPRAAFEALPFGTDPATIAFYQSLGLRDVSGNRAKTAYKTLRTQTLNRGWWRESVRDTRKFHLGFTPAPYDGPTDPMEYAVMQQWLVSRWNSDSSIMNFHLDSGVPWTEALHDTFTSSELPYSAAFKQRWAELKATLPPAHKLVVSVNPLGVPRSVIAPYFGVGQGFTYSNTDNFRRIPDGVVKDTDNRMPPPPFDSYELNHPDVMRAFVNYCKRTIQYFNPDYLVVAIETTATMHEGYPAYDRYLELQRYVYQQLKADPATRHVPIGVSVSTTSFVADEYGVPLKYEEQPDRRRDLQLQGLIDLLPYVDMVALSLYPHYGKYSATYILGAMYDDLLSVLEAAGKPIAITESGWVAETFDLLGFPFISSEEKQDLFLAHLFYTLEHTPLPVEYVIAFAIRDNDHLWERLRQGSLQTPPTVSPLFVEFYKYFRDIGIYDGEGRARPSWYRWQEMLARPFAPVPW